MKRWLGNLAALGVGLIFSASAAEMMLRLAGVHYPAFYSLDAQRGYRLRPGAAGLWTREGHGWVRINRAGFRGAETSRHPAAASLRVAVLGDSFTEALQVDEPLTLVGQLQRQLAAARACSLRVGHPSGVEVLNFGVGGYGTAQELLTWRHLARGYQPHLVLLVVYPGNDFQDNEPRVRPDRPVMRLRSSGALVVDNSFRDTAVYRWRSSPPGQLLEGLAPLLRPGGRLVYATCTVHPRENGELIAAFLAAHPGWRLLESWQLWPGQGPGGALEDARASGPGAPTAEADPAPAGQAPSPAGAGPGPGPGPGPGGDGFFAAALQAPG